MKILNKFFFRITIRSLELYILSIVNILYILSALIYLNSNALNYLVALISLLILFSYLLFAKKIYNNKMYVVKWLFMLFVVIYISFPYVHVSDIYIRLFVLKLMLLTLFIEKSKITLDQFTKIVNFTYFTYFFLSLCAWFKIIPGVYNSFIIDTGLFHMETFYGVSGSTADIDSYSVIVALWNILMYKGKYKFILILLPIIAALLTMRGTPIVAFIFSILIYFLVKNKTAAIIVYIVLICGFISTLVILYYIPTETISFFDDGITWYEFFWVVSHARTAIWCHQIIYYLNDFSLANYFYGPDLKDMIVPFTRPDGLELEENYNPHNSYLITLYRSTLLFIILYSSLFYFSIKNYYKRTFPIVFIILITALTNSSMFGLENPTYVLMLLFVIIKSKEIKTVFTRR